MRLAATLAVLAGLSACGSVAPPGVGDPYAIPYEALSEKQAELVHGVMDQATVMVELERTPVASRPEVYIFLMHELPFTAGVLRELGLSKYRITRDEAGQYHFDDTVGLTLDADLVREEERRWIWYTRGVYDMGLFSAVGRSVIIVRYAPDGETLLTEARVYAKVDSKFLEGAAKALRGVVEKIIRDKSFVFVTAARSVAEMTARDAEGLYKNLRGSAYVDAATLEEFRRKFVR